MEMVVAGSSSTKPQRRGKIVMKLIDKKSNREVTFSKRRVSIFRKASELATLCGVKVAILIFSPGGRIYSFGHPSVEAVIERFESPRRNPSFHGADLMSTAHEAERAQRLKMELERTESLKKKRKMLDLAWERELRLNHWWNADVSEMDLPHCIEMYERLMELKVEVEAEQANRQISEYHSNKALVSHVNPEGWNFAPNYGDLIPSTHPVGVNPNNLGSGWIDSCASPFGNIVPDGEPSNGVNVSPVTNLQNGMYNIGGGTSDDFEPQPSSSSTGEIMGFGQLGPNKYLFPDYSSHMDFNKFRDL